MVPKQLNFLFSAAVLLAFLLVPRPSEAQRPDRIASAVSRPVAQLQHQPLSSGSPSPRRHIVAGAIVGGIAGAFVSVYGAGKSDGQLGATSMVLITAGGAGV